jgi:hypothetical protein
LAISDLFQDLRSREIELHSCHLKICRRISGSNVLDKNCKGAKNACTVRVGCPRSKVKRCLSPYVSDVNLSMLCEQIPYIVWPCNRDLEQVCVPPVLLCLNSHGVNQASKKSFGGRAIALGVKGGRCKGLSTGGRIKIKDGSVKCSWCQ